MKPDPLFALDKRLPKPEFMLIGAAKCGTTSLEKYLSVHPQIRSTRVKEPNFWTWQSCNNRQYQSLFVNPEPAINPKANQVIGGDYSTSSILHPIVPLRVHAALPHTKIIALLRHPVDRAYSHFMMSKEFGREPSRSFDEIVLREIDEIEELLASHQRAFAEKNYRTNSHRSAANGKPISVSLHDKTWSPLPLLSEKELHRFYFCSYVFRSVYHDQLWRWMQLFPNKQMLVMQAETFYKDTGSAMSKIIKFLGLAPHDFGESLQQPWGAERAITKRAPSGYADMSKKTRTLLKDFFKPYNEKLFKLIGDTYDWA